MIDPEDGAEHMNDSTNAQSVLAAALSYAATGMSVVAVKLDGTKEPLGKWKHLQQRILTEDEIRKVFQQPCGIGVLNGVVSGNKELLDIDNPELVEPFEAAVRALSPGLLERIPTVATPRGNHRGRHYHYRVQGIVAGNTKLAESQPVPQFNADGTPQIDPKTGKQKLAPDTWIETRGEGGYSVMPGSPGQCHASGLPYKHIAGPTIAEMPTLSTEEHALLWRVAQSFNRNFTNQEVRGEQVLAQGGMSPGQAYCARTSWDEILCPAGWQRAYAADGVTHWRRPGKETGSSATTGLCSKTGNDLLCVFSSNAYPFEGPANGKPCTSYNKFAAYTVLHHAGDFGAAAKALAGAGYGDSPKTTKANSGQRQIKLVLPDPYVPFPIKLLPPVCADFVSQAARSIDCDEGMVALPLMAGIAAAIGNTCRIQLKRDYSEPAIVWGAVVCESGTRKSPALEVPLARIRRREMEESRRFTQDQAAYQIALRDYTTEVARCRRSKTGGAPSDPPIAPIQKRYIVSDTTVEALADRMHHNPRGLFLVNDELAAFFSAFNQYKSGKGSDESHYLAMFGGRTLVVDRKNAIKPSLVVPMASLSVVGSIQPGILEKAFNRDRMDSGMAARFLLVKPPVRVVKWQTEPLGQLAEDRLAAMFDHILELPVLIEEDTDAPRPRMLPLTDDAMRLWIDFHDEHSVEQAELEGDIAAAWSKLTGYAARLSLICEMAAWAVSSDWEPPSRVGELAMRSGIALARWFANETKRIYDTFGESDTDREVRNLVDYIRRQGGFVTERDLCRGPRKYRRHPESASADLQNLVNGGLGRWIPQPPGALGGRPTQTFCLNGYAPGDETGLITGDFQVSSPSPLT